MEYDGSHYAGFQLQSQQPTIQGEIEQALNKFTGELIRIRAASRTDAGAHARGQVIDFLTASLYPIHYFPRALNHYLPSDIKVQAAFEMELDFHSRRDASNRVYRYCIANREWPSPLERYSQHWVREPLDIERMDRAAQDLVGVHDFRPLAMGHPGDKSAVRNVLRWGVVGCQGETITIDCQANGFLRHQIRRANAALVEIGKGRWPIETIKESLNNPPPEGLGWPSLPARGLCLMKVNYPDFWSKVRTSDETD